MAREMGMALEEARALVALAEGGHGEAATLFAEAEAIFSARGAKLGLQELERTRARMAAR